MQSNRYSLLGHFHQGQETVIGEKQNNALQSMRVMYIFLWGNLLLKWGGPGGAGKTANIFHF